jgi:hypothetical protein
MLSLDGSAPDIRGKLKTCQFWQQIPLVWRGDLFVKALLASSVKPVWTQLVEQVARSLREKIQLIG